MDGKVWAGRGSTDASKEPPFWKEAVFTGGCVYALTDLGVWLSAGAIMKRGTLEFSGKLPCLDDDAEIKDIMSQFVELTSNYACPGSGLACHYPTRFPHYDYPVNKHIPETGIQMIGTGVVSLPEKGGMSAILGTSRSMRGPVSFSYTSGPKFNFRGPFFIPFKVREPMFVNCFYVPSGTYTNELTAAEECKIDIMLRAHLTDTIANTLEHLSPDIVRTLVQLTAPPRRQFPQGRTAYITMDKDAMIRNRAGMQYRWPTAGQAGTRPRLEHITLRNEAQLTISDAGPLLFNQRDSVKVTIDVADDSILAINNWRGNTEIEIRVMGRGQVFITGLSTSKLSFMLGDAAIVIVPGNITTYECKIEAGGDSLVVYDPDMFTAQRKLDITLRELASVEKVNFKHLIRRGC